jgi:phage shock protein E
MPRIVLLALASALFLTQPALAQTASKPVPPAVAANYLKKPNTVLLDVRTPAEFAAGHLKGARNIDFKAAGFSFEIAKLDKDKTYLLYCASGNRSGQTTILMEETGFKKVINVGAFEELQKAGLKTKK